MRRERWATAATAASVLALLGCGVPTDREARTLGTPPFGLLTTSTTTPAGTVPPEESDFWLTLYWVTADDQIVPGEPIGLARRPTFQEVVDLLAQGPPASTSNGAGPTTGPGSNTPAPALRTFITENLNPEPEDSDHRAVGPLVLQVSEDGTLDLLVDDRFRDESQATPTRFRLAIAQVVCTVTQYQNVDEVRFFDSRGQLTLVNLEQNPIETGTRGNIGQCDRPTTSRTPTTLGPTTTSTATTAPAPPVTSTAGRATTIPS